jgi:hypothetical protein
LKKQIANWEAEAKASLELVAGERKAAQLNGVTVAYTNKVKGRKSVKVLDEYLLMGFVHAVAPGEIETIEQIRPAYRTKLLDQALKDGKLTDPEGVVWDCVEVVEGEPYLTTKLTDDAPIVIAGLLAAGRIGIDGIKALEA